MINDENVRTCDVCDDETTEACSVTFSWNGGGWIADLCDAHAHQFFDTIKPFIDAARIDEHFINNRIEAPEGFTVVAGFRNKRGAVVKPTLKRNTPSKCPLCQRKFVAFNGLGAHISRTHSEKEQVAVGWYKRMTYDEYLTQWPNLDSSHSSISLAGLVQKKPARK